LARLLGGGSAAVRELAWERFVQTHSTLLLQVARSITSDHDGAMDHYVYVLDELRRNDYRRLRAYAPDGSTNFTTWLVVVARRLCVDHYRRVYGRPWKKDERTTGPSPGSARRRLIDLVGEDISVDDLPASEASTPDSALCLKELSQKLGAAVAKLPERDQILLRLRFEEDLAIREIAALMRYPTVFRVYRRINAVLRELRATLATEGIDDPEA
jgi:RNA polymerase sigma factor (sigma-70 family)